MIKKLLIKLIKWYQAAPLRSHNNCKYIPSCSNYALDALNEFNTFKAVGLIIWRILRCNPFSKGGIDYIKKRS